MKKIPGKEQLSFYLTEKLKEDFEKQVKNGKQSDTLRGMMMLYLTKTHFRVEVDKFVEVTKTI